jgi:hypothetical protein
MFERHSWSLLVLVCVIMYLIIFHAIDRLPVFLKDIQYICLSSCESDLCQTMTSNLRDKSYWLDPEGLKKTDPIKCGMTLYEMTHLLFHVWIGYEYGICTSSLLSITFELFEHMFYNCGSFLDILWNLIGAFIGIAIRIYVQ